MARLGKEPRRFVRAAEQRLQEAQFLLANSEYTTASIYLAGYAVECILKALILASEPEAHHPQTMKSFRGARGHEFAWLQEQLDQRQIAFSSTIRKALNDVSRWTTNIRYDPGIRSRREAEVFLNATEAILRWGYERLGNGHHET